MKKIKKIAYIKWIDSSISLLNRWDSIENFLESIEVEKKPVETVGFVIKEDKDWLYLATSTTCTNSINCGFVIFKKNIIKRINL